MIQFSYLSKIQLMKKPMQQSATFIFWLFFISSLGNCIYANNIANLSSSNQLAIYNSNTPKKLTYQVGPSSLYKKPSDIARIAKNGSIIEIEAGIYPEDVAVWRQSNITIRGVGGLAHLQANGKVAEAKDIWVIKGNNVGIENISFSGARTPYKNGAVIRMEGTNLTLRHCHFHDNEMGILTGRNLASEIMIENSEFNNNTVDYKRHQRLGHNIYIGEIAKFTLTGSYVHDAEIGHNVKSRARENYILYNRITDENLGSSYLVDLPNGGNAFIIGNIFHQNPVNDNSTLLSFAAEKNRGDSRSSLYVVNNTFVNSAQNAIFIANHSIGLTTVINNLFVGSGKIRNISKTPGPEKSITNIQLLQADFVNKQAFDYRLQKTMTNAINQGVIPIPANNGFTLVPKYQYTHPAATEPRPINRQMDVGAYEFVR